MTRYWVEGKSIGSGEVSYGKAFEATSEVHAIAAAREDYEGGHSRSANMKIEFNAWEQDDYQAPKF